MTQQVVPIFSTYVDEKTEQTLLHLAVRVGDIELIEMILSHGQFPMSAVDKGGNTALHIAAAMGKEIIAELLLGG